MSKRSSGSVSEDEELAPLSRRSKFDEPPDDEIDGRSTSGMVTPSSETSKAGSQTSSALGISTMGLRVLILLIVQNSSKTLLMRYVLREKPDFLPSAAVIGSELTKFSLSTLYIIFVERKPPSSIVTYIKEDWKNTVLVAVPASAYNLQMSLEYVALANLDAAMFSVLVQTKLLFTATFAAVVLGKKLKYIQVMSLVLLTSGVMLCNLKMGNASSDESNMKGITATLGIAVSSGFASVFTEKVIKTQRAQSPVTGHYSLAYTQVQLATMSLVTIGVYALIMDFGKITEFGLFHNFNVGAFLTILNSAFGGLIVAGVLKYADSVLKGYATSISVIVTGLSSMVLFGTELHAVYFMGIINVIMALLLYNGNGLEQNVC